MTALTILQAKRDCNGCAECCVTMKVQRADESWKPCGEACEHLVGTGKQRGCGQYEMRWQGCRDFVCAWAAGVFPEELWPAKTRVVPSFSKDGNALVLYEHTDRPGAWRSGRLGQIVEIMRRELQRSVIVVRDDRRTLLPPL
jgi:hypothetical protein